MSAYAYATTDIDAALAFLRRRFEFEHSGYAILVFFGPGGDVHHCCVPLDSARRWEIARREIESHADWDAYVAVATFAARPAPGSRRTKAMVAHLNAVWCERDAAVLPDSLPAPTITVETSPGRFQDYWVLDRPISAERAEELTRRIARAVGLGNEAVDAVRILRLPGTVNRKRAYDAPVVRVVRDSGETYAVRDFDHLPAAPLPPRATVPYAAEGGIIANGSRNATLTSLAGTMRRRGMSESAIFAALTEENATRCDPPLDGAEVAKIARSISRYEPAPHGDVAHGHVANWQQPRRDTPPEDTAIAGSTPRRPLTDLGNAERLIDAHGHDLRYVIEREAWAEWDGTRWRMDDTGAVDRRAKATVRAIYEEAARLPGASEREAAGKHAVRSEAAPRVQAMIERARKEAGIPIHLTDFDSDPWALNCMNGTLDLRTGTLRPHDRNELHMKRVPVDYDPAAICPTWLAFLARIMADNDRLITFLQRAIGYSLTGETQEQVFFVLHGVGANGKSTLLETLAALLDDYAQQAPIATFLRKQHDAGIPNDIARMVGARFISAVEADDGVRLSESLIKQLTGGDRFTARFLHREFFDFKPEFKLWLSVNHRPTIKGTEHAMWRRVLLIPFTVVIPDDEQDKNLKRTLRAELPGILAWAVRGCLDWQRGGLAIPEEVRAATDDYRRDMDTLAHFLTDRCDERATAWTAAGALYGAYRDWCEKAGERFDTQQAFGRRLAERGFTQGKHAGVRGWFGLTLNDSAQAEAFDEF